MSSGSCPHKKLKLMFYFLRAYCMQMYTHICVWMCIVFYFGDYSMRSNKKKFHKNGSKVSLVLLWAGCRIWHGFHDFDSSWISIKSWIKIFLSLVVLAHVFLCSSAFCFVFVFLIFCIFIMHFLFLKLFLLQFVLVLYFCVKFSILKISSTSTFEFKQLTTNQLCSKICIVIFQ